MNRRLFLYGGGAAVVAGAAIWQAQSALDAEAGPVTTDAIGDKVQRVPKGELPQFADASDLRQLYRYAVEHGDELQYVPCTCGCVRFGHKSNRDCYIKAAHGDGALTFTSHAAT